MINLWRWVAGDLRAPIPINFVSTRNSLLTEEALWNFRKFLELKIINLSPTVIKLFPTGRAQ